MVAMLQATPGMRAIAVFDEIRRRHPGDNPAYPPHAGTADAEPGAPSKGPSRMSSSARNTSPVRLGLSDFTDTSELGVAISGVPLEHRLYHFRLAFSASHPRRAPQ